VNIIVLVIVVFFTDGTPVASLYTIPEGKECNETVAMRFAKDYGTMFPEQKIQETVLWNCLPVQSIGPGPAMQPALYPGNTDAATTSLKARVG